MSIPKILICVPVYEAVKPAAYFAQARIWKQVGLDAAAGLYEATLKVVGPRVAIREVRNRCCQEALSGGFSHILFLDDDILPARDLVSWLVGAGKPIIGALVNDSVGKPIVFKGDAVGEERWLDHPADRDFPCWAVGSGAILIERAVLERLSAPWFYYDKTARSMDVNFCRDAQAAGFEVWCSVTVACKQLTHETLAK